MKFAIIIVVSTLLVLVYQSSFATARGKQMDVAAVVESVQSLIQNIESETGKLAVNQQTTGGPLFQLQLLFKDLIQAIGNLQRSVRLASRLSCRCR